MTPVNLPLQLKQTWVLLLWLLLEEHSTIMCLLPMVIWQCTMREHLLTAAQATVPMMVNITTMPIFCVTLMHQMLQFANRLVGQGDINLHCTNGHNFPSIEMVYLFMGFVMMLMATSSIPATLSNQCLLKKRLLWLLELSCLPLKRKNMSLMTLMGAIWILLMVSLEIMIDLLKLYFRCNSSHNWQIFLFHDHNLSMGSNVLLWRWWSG